MTKLIRIIKVIKGKYIQDGLSRNRDDFCCRCINKCHWSKTCRTVKHQCKIHKEYVEGKEKEVNFNKIEPKNNTTNFKVFDFVKETI